MLFLNNFSFQKLIINILSNKMNHNLIPITKLKMNKENLEFIKNAYKIMDKLEQRISTLEKVLESHAKCIGQLREDKKDDNN